MSPLTAFDLYLEAKEALETVWFVQSVEEMDCGENDYSARLHVAPELFVQVFFGSFSATLYFALIKADTRIYGIDLDGGEWHVHPHDNPRSHRRLTEGLGPRPLTAFLSRVEKLLLSEDLL